mgnify:CR=1 FL=1
MTINGIHPSELVEHRLRQERADRNKRVSDLKNNTEKLTLSDKQQGEIAQKNRARIDALEMKRLLTADDVSELTQMIKDL